MRRMMGYRLLRKKKNLNLRPEIVDHYNIYIVELAERVYDPSRCHSPRVQAQNFTV